VTTWHLLTGEYPPSHGGVSDYSRAIAGGLAAAGDSVHVWCPEAGATGIHEPNDVQVHRIAGTWGAADLHRVDREMNAVAGSERRLLLQWVPHAYGKRSLNVRFCRWVRRRAKAGDELDIMVHEPGLAFREGNVRQDVAAAIHRLMLTTLLSDANRVWVAIPAWADVLRRWAIGRNDLRFAWLPVPSTLPVVQDPDAVRRIRAERLVTPGDLLVGHFSTYQPAIRHALCELIPRLLSAIPPASGQVHIALLGRGGDAVAKQLQAISGDQGNRITATGDLDAASLSHALQACDLLIQPYPDGASSRRTTLMAALAHGIPVATTTGRLSESFWKDSTAVATAPAADSAALLQVVADLLRDQQRRSGMARSARTMYEERFSLHHVIHALRAEPCGAMC
jgi:glycosyltransferase involved in cell wall biosynthesis